MKHYKIRNTLTVSYFPYVLLILVKSSFRFYAKIPESDCVCLYSYMRASECMCVPACVLVGASAAMCLPQ